MPPPDQPPQNIVFAKFAGLNNVVSPERLDQNELAVAINIDLDDRGQPHRRRGRRKVHDAPHHSLFQADDLRNYVVRDGVLGLLNADFSFKPIKDGIANFPLWYTQVGPRIYYSNKGCAGTINVETDTYEPWGADGDIWLSPVANPTATLPPVRGRLLGPPPLATMHCYYSGRIYMAHGRTVWATELWAYDYIDKTKNFWTFEADVTMLGCVGDGIYVGTQEGLWFISGPYGEAKRVRVMDNAVVPGSMVYVPSELANPPQVPIDQDTPAQISILFMTLKGYCGGQDSGVCYNFSENKFIFPTMSHAAAMFRRQDGMNQYVVVGNSEGSPSSNARFGDYVDVEIRRGGAGWISASDGVKFGDKVDAVIA